MKSFWIPDSSHSEPLASLTLGQICRLGIVPSLDLLRLQLDGYLMKKLGSCPISAAIAESLFASARVISPCVKGGWQAQFLLVLRTTFVIEDYHACLMKNWLALTSAVKQDPKSHCLYEQTNFAQPAYVEKIPYSMPNRFVTSMYWSSNEPLKPKLIRIGPQGANRAQIEDPSLMNDMNHQKSYK
ncbi:hypothetical protein HAX54_019010 [Datura stramonium]|uniref:Uncharacterized protein n=1 Tax=Datura stramonium TaxID=4076 RepID=A0ABS8Y3K9_DATST|nr:hypothetical protein [Datura stramonium]